MALGVRRSGGSRDACRSRCYGCVRLRVAHLAGRSPGPSFMSREPPLKRRPAPRSGFGPRFRLRR